jgi:hypothetical protein
MKGAIQKGLDCGCIRVEDCLLAKPAKAARRRSRNGAA